MVWYVSFDLTLAQGSIGGCGLIQVLMILRPTRLKFTTQHVFSCRTHVQMFYIIISWITEILQQYLISTLVLDHVHAIVMDPYFSLFLPSVCCFCSRNIGLCWTSTHWTEQSCQIINVLVLISQQHQNWPAHDGCKVSLCHSLHTVYTKTCLKLTK